MSFNSTGAVSIPLSLFGGLVTQEQASNLPEGVSPDCQDVTFRPGSVMGRPGLTGVLSNPLASNPTYAKSYVANDGTIRNIYLDALGNLSVENISTTPGTLTVVGTLTPGSYAKSITAFGREYIAPSDGLHGSDIPLQYDGTFLDRVTQDGPGSPPAIGNLLLPEVSMLAPTNPAGLTVLTIVPTDLDPTGRFYTSVTITVVSGASQAQPGNIVVTTGSAGGAPLSLNGSFPVAYVLGDTQIVAFAVIPAPQASATGGTATISIAHTMVRANNIVTVHTNTAHGLQVGYRAQISGKQTSPFTTFPAMAVGEISGGGAIVIDNEDNPGIATVTTLAAHGLASGNVVIIDNVIPVTVGGTISSMNRQGQVVTVVTSAANGLKAGVTVNIVGPGNATFAGTFTVATVTDIHTFTYFQVDTDATSSGGTVQLNWPLPALATPSLFEVLDIPSPNSFTVAFNYADAQFTTGAVWFPWAGTFYVKSVPSPTTFTYLQYGPDGDTDFIGTVTPVGQAAPGIHQMQVLFLTRQGYVTTPSPPVQFNANGGQYLAVSNIPIGPSNVVARILAFTGTGGADFFYIPAPPLENGQVVGTPTQINDNTTTSTVIDFGDTTLFRSLAISTQGNDLAAQIVLDGALGFFHLSTRLLTYGQRNRIQNFLNLMFDGGYQLVGSPAVQQPTGWLPEMTGSPVVISPGGALTTGGRWGQAWQFSGSGFLYQSAYVDAYGAPILTGDTQYTFRAWLKGVGATATLTITSASAGFTATATITGVSATGSWLQADFSSKTPVNIPADMILKLSGTGGGTVDEISILYTAQPFLDRIINGSYVNNPEAFDGVSGVFGPDDTRKVMTGGIIRDSLFLLTRDPAGRIHVVRNNDVTEPAGWIVDEVDGNCGAMSAFCLTVSQADDASAAGGEEWLAWMSYAGARIFGGDLPELISEEIGPDWAAINTGSWLTTWALNDPAARRIYFGLPKGLLAASPTILASAPNLIYPVDYQNLHSAAEIANSPPIHVTLQGKLSARDHARKWTRWNIAANGAAMIYRNPGGPLYTVFLGGNGVFPGQSTAGCPNIFALCDGKLTDDCLGQIHSYYITYAFTSAELETALGLGGARKLMTYLTYSANGVGRMKVTPLINTLTNPWPIKSLLPLRADPTYDDEWGAGNAQGQRIFLKFEALPVA